MRFSSPREFRSRSFFVRRSTTVLLAGLLFAPIANSVAQQQTAPAATDAQAPASTPADAPAGTTTADQTPTAVLSNTPRKKTRKTEDTKQEKRDEKVKQTKDTIKEQKRMQQRLKANPLANVNTAQPDKLLFDRAMVALNKGHYDVSRLLLQDMLATYPDSEFQMRAKLAFADSWYKEGGTAALTQAETEYKDFIVFFPNAPEAAEAQMRIGDIYFKQMDKPDRDYAKAVHAQEEYRNMLTQYPDSKLIPEAKQKLREVQEVLATRETGIADFYAGHDNYAASIARYQTVVDTYPLYSKIDSALIGLGDAYAAQARFVRSNPAMKNLSEDQRARLLKVYEDQAAAAYGRVVTVYNASPRVEDARDRLEALGAPIPEPTAEQVAASQALENSRQTYSIANRAKGLILRGPDVVQAARIGDPGLADPHATYAPQVSKRIESEFNAAVGNKPVAAAAANAPAAAGADDSTAAAPAGSTAASSAPATLSDIPANGAPTDAADAGSTTTVPVTPAGVAPATGNRSVGVEILTPGASTTTDAGYGLPKPGPANTALPPVEKAAEIPDAVNDAAGVKTPAGQQTPQADDKGKVKTPKPDYDSDVESSSKHKKKKGVKKLNPF
ncbi:outer membrane protein assembly factor BamD [Terriglobus aquaticus]|uniref:Outer membrane protein assembly factor BamD n=1 Tax=Terriglobus aquaticus TaxID=940139 RepID=A0ABW9KQA7_9BACT|nr:outer membrane protein assembly factor BamD [Terriglobus aquaticus]